MLDSSLLHLTFRLAIFENAYYVVRLNNLVPPIIYVFLRVHSHLNFILKLDKFVPWTWSWIGNLLVRGSIPSDVEYTS